MGRVGRLSDGRGLSNYRFCGTYRREARGARTVATLAEVAPDLAEATRCRALRLGYGESPDIDEDVDDLAAELLVRRHRHIAGAADQAAEQPAAVGLDRDHRLLTGQDRATDPVQGANFACLWTTLPGPPMRPW